MGDGLDIVWEIDASTIPCLEDVGCQDNRHSAARWQHTSGDSSSNIFAPRVSTWMTFGPGRLEVDAVIEVPYGSNDGQRGGELGVVDQVHGAAADVLRCER